VSYWNVVRCTVQMVSKRVKGGTVMLQLATTSRRNVKKRECEKTYHRRRSPPYHLRRVPEPASVRASQTRD